MEIIIRDKIYINGEWVPSTGTEKVAGSGFQAVKFSQALSGTALPQYMFFCTLFGQDSSASHH